MEKLFIFMIIDEMFSGGLVLWNRIPYTERLTHKTFYSVIDGMLKPKYSVHFFGLVGKSFYKQKFFDFQFWMKRFSGNVEL